MNSRKILVLGGTGAMGTYLVALLSQQGYEVMVSSRSRNDTIGQVRYLRGDAHDPRFLNPILASEKWSAIIDFMVYSTAAFQARAQSLLDATAQYIFLSSSRVYAQSSTPLTEDSPRLLDASTDQTYLATDEYALTKARQENVLFASDRVNWTIIRPYITFSHERLQLGVLEKEDWLFRAMNGRCIFLLKDINDCHTTLTHGEDVAKGIIAIIGEAKALGEAFHITSPTALGWSEVLDAYCRTLATHNNSVPRVRFADLVTFMRVHPSKYQIIYDRLYDRVFDNTKISRFIDTRQFKDPLQSLQSCLNTFLAKPRFLYVSAKHEALKDLATEERTPLGQLPSVKQKIRYIATRLLDGSSI
ncbi:NAD-dependent epimerase/dehydratase family protein [Hydrogenophaga taeniospiralis]|uniref:NAD-dependent epimerase/dehydratase family protein n=1 Tax=Hydrogenophaga taeniospiralis TaxID=65656 RepID=UPI001CFC1DD4|nr:NAD-dependent epimerase/dehydratase family protein [Hydrogenophaga taeniospiralis]UCU92209.1 NAD-dependent epimerase/dehydratase family protein [Hydrogenophaga taeniospiralis]